MIEFDFNICPKFLDNGFMKKKAEIDKAVMSVGYLVRNKARAVLKASPYKLSSVADNGIVIGRLKKDKLGALIKVHAFGRKGNGNLARIFIAGTIMRYKRGYIKPNPAIEQAASQEILDNKIRDILR